MLAPLIVGLVLGGFWAVVSGFRTATGRNAIAMRNPDGSIKFGLLPALILGAIWFVIGFGVTWLILLPF